MSCNAHHILVPLGQPVASADEVVRAPEVYVAVRHEVA